MAMWSCRARERRSYQRLPSFKGFRGRGPLPKPLDVRQLLVLVVVAVLVAATLGSIARASDLIDRNAHGVTLKVNRQGEALLTYTAGGKRKHVLAWGALNALAPSTARAQISFRLDYAGGWGKYHRDYWKTLRDACRKYDGPAL